MNAVVIYYIDSSLLRPNEKMYPDTTQSLVLAAILLIKYILVLVTAILLRLGISIHYRNSLQFINIVNTLVPCN